MLMKVIKIDKSRTKVGDREPILPHSDLTRGLASPPPFLFLSGVPNQIRDGTPNFSLRCRFWKWLAFFLSMPPNNVI